MKKERNIGQEILAGIREIDEGYETDITSDHKASLAP